MKACKQETLHAGDTVCVAPTNPLAIGRGLGVLTRVGQTLVLVQFAQWPRPVACLLRDCRIARIDNGPTNPPPDGTMTKDEILTAIEAQQMIQQRNRPTSERWQEASVNLAVLATMLNGRDMCDSTGTVRGL